MQATVAFRNIDLTATVTRPNGTPLAYNQTLIAFGRAINEAMQNIDYQLADIESNIEKISGLKALYDDIHALTPENLADLVRVPDPYAGTFGAGNDISVNRSHYLSIQMSELGVLKESDLDKIDLRFIANGGGGFASPTDRYHATTNYPVPQLPHDYSSHPAYTSVWYEAAPGYLVQMRRDAPNTNVYQVQAAFPSSPYKQLTAQNLDAFVDQITPVIDAETDRLSQVSQFKQAYIQDQATVNETMLKMATNLLQHMESTGQSILKAM